MGGWWHMTSDWLMRSAAQPTRPARMNNSPTASSTGSMIFRLQLVWSAKPFLPSRSRSSTTCPRSNSSRSSSSNSRPRLGSSRRVSNWSWRRQRPSTEKSSPCSACRGQAVVANHARYASNFDQVHFWTRFFECHDTPPIVAAQQFTIEGFFKRIKTWIFEPHCGEYYMMLFGETNMISIFFPLQTCKIHLFLQMVFA